MAINDRSLICAWAWPKRRKAPPANVDKYPRLSVDPEEITGRRAIAVDPGSTRPQDLHCYRIRGAALSQRAGWDGEKGEQANNHGSDHESTSFYLSWFQQSCKAAR